MKILLLFYSIIAILLISVLIASVYSSTVGHEQAHVTINEYFGMDSNYVVTVSFEGISGLTTPDSNDKFYSPEDRRAAYMMHGINEAIGYQLTPFFIGIMSFFIIMIMLLIINMGREQYYGNDNNRWETTKGKGSNCGGLEQPMP